MKFILQNWIVTIVKPLLSEPEQLEIQEFVDESGLYFTLKVAAQDRGKMIGRQGAVAKALRTLVSLAGSISGDVRATLRVWTPEKPDFIPRDK
jgi:predicted RNA-binding protein YlqC (UPF0109 family)